MDMLLDEERVVLDVPVDEHECGARDCPNVAAWWFEHSCGAFSAVCGAHRRLIDERWVGQFCATCGSDLATPLPWVSL